MTISRVDQNEVIALISMTCDNISHIDQYSISMTCDNISHIDQYSTSNT